MQNRKIHSATSFIRGVLNVAYCVTLVGGIFFLLGSFSAVINPHIARFSLMELGLLTQVSSQRVDQVIRLSEIHSAMDEPEAVTLVDVQFRCASRGFTLFLSMLFLGLIGIFLYILKLLRDIFTTLSDGSPFIRENADRIRRIGWLMISAQLVILSAGAVLIFIFRAPFDIQGAHVRLYWYPLVDEVQGALKGIFAGIIVLVIANVYRVGVEMKEEQELTV